MTPIDQTEPKHFNKGRIREFAFGIAASFVCAILLLWTWNTLATDLFGLQAAQFKHAIAAVAGIAGITAMVSGVRKLAG